MKRAFRVVVLIVAATMLLPASPTSAAVTPGPAFDRCYVQATHRVFLKRAATWAETTRWSELFYGGTHRSRLPSTLAGSDEWLSVEVDVIYRAALDRPADDAGRAYWVGRLRAGALVNAIGASIYGSTEFYARSGGTPASFVSALYARILGREPTAADVEYWATQIPARGRAWVAASFFGSIESRRGRVERLYRDILGRNVDAAGRDYWVGQLATVNDVKLATLLASSGEFYQRSQTTCPPSDVERLTVASSYVQAGPISDDGSIVAFSSKAANLVPGDTNGEWDIFVRDRTTGVTTRVTNSVFFDPQVLAISGDGRYVAYRTPEGGVVPGDLAGSDDLFVFDRMTSTTERITDGAPFDDVSGASFSPDGRYLAFGYGSSSLVTGTTGAHHIYLWDRASDAYSRVTPNGANDVSSNPIVSNDGRYVAYDSSATNLVPGDTNGARDVFLHDRTTATTTRVVAGNSGTALSDLSGSGRFVTVVSTASDLGPGGVTGFQDHVYVLDRNTSKVTKAPWPGEGYVARTSDDGRFVAFSAAPLSGGVVRTGLHLWDRSTGAVDRIVVSGGGVWLADMTPDGRFVSFHGPDDVVGPPSAGAPEAYVWRRGA